MMRRERWRDAWAQARWVCSGTASDIACKVRWAVRHRKEDALFWIARTLPYAVRYHVTIVSCAEATTGRFGDTCPTDLPMMEMLRRIDEVQKDRRERVAG